MTTEQIITSGMAIGLVWLALVVSKDAWGEQKWPRKGHLWLISGVLLVLAAGVLWGGWSFGTKS